MDNLSYMFNPGFFDTRAPFFMDFVTLIVALLPLLVVGAIALAKNKHYKAHSYAQTFIFVFSIVVFSYFEYGVRIAGGFDNFMQESSVSHNYAFIVLIAHILISLVTLFIWTMTIFKSKKQVRLHKHRKAGLITFVGVVLTSLSGIWVYFLMFVY
jgi:putative membrane protein